MSWSGAPGPNTNLVTFSWTDDSMASAAASGIEICEWPFANRKGRLVSVQFGCESLSAASAVLARIRRYDLSATSAAFLDTAAATFAAGNAAVVDHSVSTTVAAQEIFDQGDEILFDKNAGGSLTNAYIHATFAVC